MDDTRIVRWLRVLAVLVGLLVAVDVAPWVIASAGITKVEIEPQVLCTESYRAWISDGGRDGGSLDSYMSCIVDHGRGQHLPPQN